jgi:hypothetical protein
MAKEKPQWKRLSKDERKERKERIRQRKLDGKKAHEEKYGKPIASGAFGWTLVELYKTGHIRIGGGAMLELRAIEFTDLSRRKNQIGRVVGFLGTGGLNMATSTRKGEAFLAIATSSVTRTLKTSEVRPSDIETANMLVAASKTVIGQPSPESRNPEVSGGHLAGELERLSKLRGTGALTEQEFADAKRKILGN